MTILILTSLPSAIGLYWLTTSAFSIAQQLIINRTLNKNDSGVPAKSENHS
jgi:membrane protein insertase Oxa1/YidC/SpoIIIJ